MALLMLNYLTPDSPASNRLILNYLIPAIIVIGALSCKVSCKVSAYPSVSVQSHLPQSFHRLDKQRVLVLNSYTQGYPWTDNIVRAIQEKFSDNPNIITHIEYMDTQIINSRAHFEQLKQLYQNKYAGYTIDVIISSDDEALKFLREYREEIFPDVPVVFCGVNNFNEKKVLNFHNYTGISEKSSFTANFELILALHPDVKNLYVINDNSPTARSLQTGFFEASKEYEDKFDIHILSNISLDHLINKVSSIEPNSVIYYLSFASDNTGRAIHPDEVIPKISQFSPAPIYGSVDYMLGYGIVGGMLGSGYFQGRSAADAAQKIIEGYNVNKIPVILSNPNTYRFDHHQLQRFGIAIADLPPDSAIVNRPDTFLEKYRQIILIGIVVVSLLIIYIMLLVIAVKKRMKTNRGIAKIVRLSPRALDTSSADAFKETLLAQLRQMLPVKSFIALKMSSNGNFDQYDITYVQGEGKYDAILIEEGRCFLPEIPLNMIKDSFDQQKNIVDKKSSTVFLKGHALPITMVYIESNRKLDSVDGHLLGLFSEKVAMVLADIEKDKAAKSLDAARAVQKGMLASNFVEFNYKNPVDLHAFLGPVKEAGGNLYDFFAKDENNIVFTIGDVSGSGVPAALFMAIVKTLVHAVSEQYHQPSDILYKVNNELYHNNRQSLSVTLFLGILNLSKGELRYANAGHQPPYFVDPKGTVQSIAVSQGVALGRFDSVEFADEQMVFAKDHGILLYSDGITRAADMEGNEYGDQRLKSSLAKVSTKQSDGIIAHLLEDLRSFTISAPPSDDMTLLFLRNCA